MANVDNDYRKNRNTFWKFVNGSIKSTAEIEVETLTDDSGSSFSSHAGKVKILKSPYRKTTVDVRSFHDHGRRKYRIQSKISGPTNNFG